MSRPPWRYFTGQGKRQSKRPNVVRSLTLGHFRHRKRTKRTKYSRLAHDSGRNRNYPVGMLNVWHVAFLLRLSTVGFVIQNFLFLSKRSINIYLSLPHTHTLSLSLPHPPARSLPRVHKFTAKMSYLRNMRQAYIGATLFESTVVGAEPLWYSATAFCAHLRNACRHAHPTRKITIATAP